MTNKTSGRDKVHDSNRHRRILSDKRGVNVGVFYGLRVLLQTWTAQMGIDVCTYPSFGGSRI